MNLTGTHTICKRYYQQPSPAEELFCWEVVCGRYHVWSVFNTFIRISTEDRNSRHLLLWFLSSNLHHDATVCLCIPVCVCVCVSVQRHSKSRLSCQSVDKEEDGQENSAREAGGQFNRWPLTRFTIALTESLEIVRFDSCWLLEAWNNPVHP